MNPAGPRRTLPQKRAAETRQQILGAAALVSARRGFGQASMDEVATEAGASKGALYHHFPSKRALFDSLLAQRLADLEPLSQLGRGADSLPERVRRLVQAFFVRADPDAVALSLEWRLQAVRERTSGEAIGAYYAELRRRIGDLLTQAADTRETTSDPDDIGLLVFGLLDGVMMQWAVDPEGVRLDDATEAVAAAVERLSGAAPGPQTETPRG